MTEKTKLGTILFGMRSANTWEKK